MIADLWHEQNYLIKLVSTTDLSPTSPFWIYLNNVGIMHTGKPGFNHREKRPDLRVEYIHMGALLGYVVDTVISAVMDMSEIDTQTKMSVLRAFNKVVWIQNDLFARHYIAEKNAQGDEDTGERGVEEGGCPFKG
jgi:hypothetical protein